MPDTDPIPQPDDHARSLDYPNPTGSATPSCVSAGERLRSEIAARGPLSFPEFLEIVLYDLDCGYYARSTGQVGREGDFYTSVSVGPLFGKLLARRFLQWWEENDRPSPWRIVEAGAHDGKLASDILATIANLAPIAWKALEYAILEPLPALREAQNRRLSKLASKLTVVESHRELSHDPLPGIAFGNEILDALPFHLIRRIGGAWKELFVAQGPELAPGEITGESELAEKVAALEGDFSEGYQTEARTAYSGFLKDLSSCLDGGLLLFVDYGFAAPEYYDIHRTSGTLRTYSKHKAAEDPLQNPGETDITAHVDFTDLASQATKLGFVPTHFSNQGSYLTHLAAPMIRAGELDDRKSIAQFQSLTHPAHLGSSFHVIEFSKNAETPREVAHRLALA